MAPAPILALHVVATVILVHAAPAATPIPPLQWLNLTALLQGSSQPPPLKNAMIGYDELSRSVIIFGGESASGLVQSQTYLLNLDTLTWSVPSPPPTLDQSPPARSLAIGGMDSAASNRHGFVIIGGKGSDGRGLSDVWEYDLNHQFWSQVRLSAGGPSPRWGASGGIDISTPPVQDPIVPGPNNTFYLSGGFDGARISSLSDVWRLNLSGTLSPNLPNDASGSWDRVSVGSPVPKFNQSGTVISSRVIVTGGCNVTTSTSDCPQQTSYIIDSHLRTDVSPTVCPAPRTGPVLIANPSRFMSTYSSQVLLLLGTVNKTRWDDEDGLSKGEVAVLDIDTGLWSRVLPSGDPGSSASPQFPTPREGAAAVSYPTALVGQSRASSSDILVFGGQDASGNFLSEVWILRAYNSSVGPSNTQWSGFGDGRLQTGIDADGSGVRVTYLSKCATPRHQDPQPTTSMPSTPTPSSPDPATVNHGHDTYDASTIHKIFSPVSLALFQVMFLFISLGSPASRPNECLTNRALHGYVTTALVITSYALGSAGLATAFTSISVTSGIPTPHLRTWHGATGLALFSLLYAVFPLVFLTSILRTRPCEQLMDMKSDQRESLDTTEKLHGDPFAGGPSSRTSHSIHASPTLSPRRRTNSWGPSVIIQTSQEGTDSDSGHSATATTTIAPEGPKKGFEVLNRPIRTRKSSTGMPYPPYDVPQDELANRSLTNIDWLQRRRSLNAIGELDYAITQARRELTLSTPATAEALVSTDPRNRSSASLRFPPILITILHIIAQIVLLGLAVVTLVELWLHAPKAAFAVFFVWIAVFYVIMIALTFRSVLTALHGRFSSPHHHAPAPPLQLPVEDSPHPGPYVHHQPPYRVVPSGPDGSYSHHGGPRSVEMSDTDDELDEDARQRIIEEEMGRREVSIITVPKRKLWITNPS